MKKWIKAFRLQTLPLAFSCILVGSAISVFQEEFNIQVFLLAILTATLLQILSNLANDYGDAISGVDNHDRLGPQRAIQSGEITKSEMKIAVILFSILSLCSGLWLLLSAFGEISLSFIALFTLGILSIAAAIKYTVGKSAYGYSGLGDIAVFIFFGLVGVCGSNFLHSKQLDLETLLPAITIGLFAMGVLNLNNLRDIENDAKFGKNTVIVKYGVTWGKSYHYALLCLGWLTFVTYLLLLSAPLLTFLPVLSLPIFIANAMAVNNHREPKELIAKLKQLAIATFLFSVLFFVSSFLQ